MDYVLGFVSRADNTAGFTNEYIPVYRYTQLPVFEMILGLGFVNTSIAKWKSLGRTQDERSFYIGWRLREDQRINEVLLQLYPLQSFPIDLAVVQMGEDGRIIPLSGYGDTLRAFLMVERYSYIRYRLSRKGYTNMHLHLGSWKDCITTRPPHQARNIYHLIHFRVRI